ncbi:MAG: oligosaccharide flippase family protein [Pseudomonadota bacterium]
MNQSGEEQERSVWSWLLRQISSVGLIHLISIPLSVLVAIVLARVMGPAQYGQYAFLISILALIALPAVMGVAQLLTREAARYKELDSWGHYIGIRRVGLVWVLVISSSVLLLAYLLAQMILGARLEAIGAAFWLGLCLVPINGLLAVHQGLAKGVGFPGLAEAPMKVLVPLFLLMSVLSLSAINQVSVYTVMTSQVAVSLVTVLLAFAILLKVEPSAPTNTVPLYDLNLWGRVYIPLMLTGLVGTLNAQIGTVLLGTLSEDAAVAGLRVAERASQFVVMPLVVINAVIAPLAVTFYARKDERGMQSVFQKATRGAFAIALVMGALFIVFGQSAIAFLFGEEYVDLAYTPLVILALAHVFNVAAGPVGVVLLMCHQEKLALLSQALGFAITAALAVLLIPVYDQVGAALAIAAGLVIWNTLMTIFVRQKLGISVGVF